MSQYPFNPPVKTESPLPPLMSQYPFNPLVKTETYPPMPQYHHNPPSNHQPIYVPIYVPVYTPVYVPVPAHYDPAPVMPIQPPRISTHPHVYEIPTSVDSTEWPSEGRSNIAPMTSEDGITSLQINGQKNDTIPVQVPSSVDREQAPQSESSAPTQSAPQPLFSDCESCKDLLNQPNASKKRKITKKRRTSILPDTLKMCLCCRRRAERWVEKSVLALGKTGAGRHGNVRWCKDGEKSMRLQALCTGVKGSSSDEVVSETLRNKEMDTEIEQGDEVFLHATDCLKEVLLNQKRCGPCARLYSTVKKRRARGSKKKSAVADPQPKPKSEEKTRKENAKKLEFLDLETAKADIARYLEANKLSTRNLMLSILQAWVSCNPEKSNSNRYTDAMYHWAITLQYIGGNRLLKLMANNLACPCKRSIARRLVLHDPLQLHDLQPYSVGALKKLSGSASVGGLVWDEVDVRSGLIYLKHLGLLVGRVSGPVYEKEVRTLKATDIEPTLAKKMCQFFYVASDGSVALPVAAYPTTGKEKGEWYLSTFDAICDQLKRVNPQIKITWTSTDDSPSSQDFAKRIKERNPDHVHLFDFVHLLKTLRNRLSEDCVCLDGQFIGLRQLTSLVEKYGKDGVLTINESYHLSVKKHLITSDKMAIEPVMKIIDARFLSWLKLKANEQSSAPLHALHKYLNALRSLYVAFMDGTTSTERESATPLTMMQAAQLLAETRMVCGEVNDNASEKRKVISKQCMEALDANVAGLRKLAELNSSLSFARSALGTNIVENFFSIMRGHTYYFDVFEYMSLGYRTFMELVKKNASDCPFVYPKGETRCYNNQTGIRYTMNLITLPTPSDNRKTVANVRNFSVAIDPAARKLDKQHAAALAITFSPASRRFTIREASTKLGLRKEPSVGKGYAFCVVEGCSKGNKAWLYEKSYISHLVWHGIPRHVVDNALQIVLNIQKELHSCDVDALENILTKSLETETASVKKRTNFQPATPRELRKLSRVQEDSAFYMGHRDEWIPRSTPCADCCS